MKKTAGPIVSPIAILIIASFRLGLFHDALKAAIVTLILRISVLNAVENNRPVSVLTTFLKVYERCMHIHYTILKLFL